MRKRKKIHYAWVVFIGVCIFNFVGYGLIINCFGLFMRPMSEAQNISVTQMSLTHTVRTFCGMITTGFAGVWMSKYNIKKYLSFVCCGLGGSALLTALASQFWQFIICAGLLGASAGMAVYTIVPLIMNQWFKEPGSYIGIATSMGGLGGMFFSPILAAVIQQYGWRGGYLLIVLAVLGLMLPISAFLIKFSPEKLGLEPYEGKKKQALSEVPEQNRKNKNIMPQEAKKMPVYYLLIPLFIVVAFISGIYTHIANMVIEKGISSLTSGIMNSLYLGGAAAAQMLLGIFSTKFGLKKTMAAFFVLIGMGVIGFSFSNGASVILIGICCILLGFGRALGVVELPIIVREIFGQKYYSDIFSKLYSIYLTSCALTTTIFGSIYDVTESYTSVVMFVGVCVILAWTFTFVSLKMKNSYRKPIKNENT